MSDASVGIGDFLTKAHPLGPTRHEQINMRLGEKHSNMLVFSTDVFDKVTRSKRPIVAGRRGSGKTAVVNALVASASGQPYSWGVKEVDLDESNIVVFIDSYKKLDILVERVGQDISHAHGPVVDWSGITSETCARYWERHLWTEVFETIYETDIAGAESRKKAPHLDQIDRFITGRDIVDRSMPITHHSLEAFFDKTRDTVISFLKERKLNCVIVIDSFEKYPLKSPRFEKVVAGLFKCVNYFSDLYARCFVYCCLPEEVEPLLMLVYSNILKDGAEESVSRLKWRPIDLLRVVGKRYREFLKEELKPSSPEGRIFFSKMLPLNLDDRIQLINFFSFILPENVVNRHGCEEPTLAYIIRHTHLVPREMLSIFASAIRSAFDRTDGWLTISSADIISAVDTIETSLVYQALEPFRTNYPTLCMELKDQFTKLGVRPVFSGSELESFKSLEGITIHETRNVWETLFHMGVIGYVENAPDGSSLNDRYVYGRFHYNSAKALGISPNNTYCVHPIFSGSWHLRVEGRCSDIKFVYPADVPFDLVQTPRY